MVIEIDNIFTSTAIPIRLYDYTFYSIIVWNYGIDYSYMGSEQPNPPTLVKS